MDMAINYDYSSFFGNIIYIIKQPIVMQVIILRNEKMKKKPSLDA